MLTMNQEQTFQSALIIGFLAIFSVTLYHRIRAATRETLDRRQEGTFMLATLRPVALLFWLGVFAYMINPAWMAWSSVFVPVWLRWTGVAISGIATVFLTWTLRSLGTNLTDTVVTRQSHTMVTRGPYRWIRHPFYVSMALLILAISLITANWFVLLTGSIVLGLLVLRTRTEEEQLVARFGEAYRMYMLQTGRFVPRWKANRRGV